MVYVGSIPTRPTTSITSITKISFASEDRVRTRSIHEDSGFDSRRWHHLLDESNQFDYGTDMKSNGNRYSDELKDKVRVRWREGASLTSLVQEFSLTKSTLFLWTRHISRNVSTKVHVGEPKRTRLLPREKAPGVSPTERLALSGLNTKVVGDISVAGVLLSCLRARYSVLLPFGDSLRYDIAIERGGVFLRVQCKTGRQLSTGIRFNTCSSHPYAVGGKKKKRNYIGDADLFGVYCFDTGQCFLVPVTDATGKGSQRCLATSPKSKAKLSAAKYEVLPETSKWS